MKIKNPFQDAEKEVVKTERLKICTGGICLKVWLVVATILSLIYLKENLYDGVYQSGVKAGMEKGKSAVIAQILQNSQNCQIVKIGLQDQEYSLQDPACMKPKEEAVVSPEEVESVLDSVKNK